MTLHLTPEMLEAAYEYLRASRPFASWGLPHGDEIEFRVMVTRDYLGCCAWDGHKRSISISASRVGHTDTLMRVMAHEMIHLKKSLTGPVEKNNHGPAFRNLARLVSRHHGFDPREL